MDDCMDILFRRTDSLDYTVIYNIRIKNELLEQINKQVGINNKDFSDVLNELLERALKSLK